MENQARKFGAVVEYDTVTEVVTDGRLKTVRTPNNTYTCKAVILCMGASPKKSLALPGRTAERFRCFLLCRM